MRPPPIGRSGRAEASRQSYSIQHVNEFDDLFDDIYHFSEAQDLEIDTLIHEEGAAQMEINLRHGHPLVLADQVFQFKRTIREVARLWKLPCALVQLDGRWIASAASSALGTSVPVPNAAPCPVRNIIALSPSYM